MISKSVAIILRDHTRCSRASQTQSRINLQAPTRRRSDTGKQKTVACIKCGCRRRVGDRYEYQPNIPFYN